LKHKPFFSVSLALCLAVATGISPAEEHEHRQLGSHEHGVGQLNIALEKKALQVEFISPAMNIIGFEHAPNTAEEEKSMRNAIEILEAGGRLFSLPNEAQCQLSKAEVETDIGGEYHDEDHEHEGHEKAEKHDDDKHHAHADEGEHDEETHSEFHAHYEFSCDKPDALTHIDVNLFDLFPGTEELQVQTIGEQGQTSVKLTTDSTPRIKL
jgi:hypothetical protein